MYVSYLFIISINGVVFLLIFSTKKHKKEPATLASPYFIFGPIIVLFFFIY